LRKDIAKTKTVLRENMDEDKREKSM